LKKLEEDMAALQRMIREKERSRIRPVSDLSDIQVGLKGSGQTLSAVNNLSNSVASLMTASTATMNTSSDNFHSIGVLSFRVD
jgi:hypothetical protein